MLVVFKVTMEGRLPAADRATATEEIRKGISLSFPLHEALDSLLIETVPEEMITDLAGRLR